MNDYIHLYIVRKYLNEKIVFNTSRFQTVIGLQTFK